MIEGADRLPRYLERIGIGAQPPADADGLSVLQAAHRTAIGFENLDAMLGRPILIDGASAFDKLVTRRRGGYCFEQNRLFADMLAEMGLPARPLLARVMLGAAPDIMPPRTHVLLLLEIGGRPYIADAGFGGSFFPPLPLADGALAHTSDGAVHRLRRIGAPGDLGGEWLLERAAPEIARAEASPPAGPWHPQYAFHLAPVAPLDLEQCNHWTSTRADSRFTTFHIVTIALPDGFATMTDRKMVITRRGGHEEREIDTARDYRAVLSDIFNIELTEDEVAALPLFATTGA